MLLAEVCNVKYELQRRYVVLSSHVLEFVKILQTLVVTVSNLPFTFFPLRKLYIAKIDHF